MRPVALMILFGLALSAPGRAAVLTADQAVKLALQKNTSVIGAEASVLSARSGLWSAYSEMVPNVSGTYDLRNTKLNPKGDLQTFQLGAQLLTFRTRSSEETDRSPSLIGSWSILSLSNWSNFSSARNAMTGARLNRQATRNDIALQARQLFYGVVRSIRLSEA